jgi:hypothetical protein
MYRQCKQWLPSGCIPERDQRLQDDLEGPGYHINRKNQLVIEAKEAMRDRGVPSPDDGDALCLTFAQPVRVRPADTKARPSHAQLGPTSWMG